MGDDSPAPAAKVYYDGCPGCAMERKKESNKGVPYKELLFVGVITLAAATFFSIIFNTLFGLSVKYWMAITTRFLLGALNGFLGPIKAYSVEVCRSEQAALGLSIVSTAWGLGVIIGPAIGGYLAQIFSLWTVSDRKYGGLSFSSKDVGQVLTVAGASLIVYQLFVYRWVDKIFGPIHSTRVAAALSIPIIAAYPFMTHLSGLKLGLAMYSAAMIKSVLAPQEQRGAANGIATTAMSLFKAAAPAAGGVIFSWAQKRQHAAFFPGDQMVFLLLNLTEVIGLMLTFKPFLAIPKQFYK
ncbi:hypothetical protein PR202_ga24867 [Eleusine coracana subsp. coracana]|uniref:Major facilitator superfamily (MFS) profile domain-containing protein n=1 Tax=Eleusine coracana subsp. coracana TaxID=191504 RepID=A0AAV5D8U8_ELECO|nr:hypothetical protein PR202_ga24867 [Eleusine coracana subsp. coracana]